MNTLFGKVYLLAGVMMAANMFVVNEVRATDETHEKKKLNEEERKKKKENNNNKKNFLPKMVLKIQLCIFYFGRIMLTLFSH